MDEYERSLLFNQVVSPHLYSMYVQETRGSDLTVMCFHYDYNTNTISRCFSRDDPGDVLFSFFESHDEVFTMDRVQGLMDSVECPPDFIYVAVAATTPGDGRFSSLYAIPRKNIQSNIPIYIGHAPHNDPNETEASKLLEDRFRTIGALENFIGNVSFIIINNGKASVAELPYKELRGYFRRHLITTKTRKRVRKAYSDFDNEKNNGVIVYGCKEYLRVSLIVMEWKKDTWVRRQ